MPTPQAEQPISCRPTPAFPVESGNPKQPKTIATNRERGEQSTVLNYAVSDAAAETSAAIKSALDSYTGLRSNSNVSGTALGQAQVAGMVTQGQLTAAMAQLQAYPGSAGGGGGTGNRAPQAGARSRAARRSAARSAYIQRTDCRDYRHAATAEPVSDCKCIPCTPGLVNSVRQGKSGPQNAVGSNANPD